MHKRKRAASPFARRLKDYKVIAKGCKFCATGACCARLADTLPAILRARKKFKEMSSLQQDRDLLWVFAEATCPEADGHSDDARPSAVGEVEEETSQSSGPKEGGEETSHSDDARPSAMGPKHQVVEEVTSASSVGENAMNPEDQEEITTSSSEFVNLREQVRPRPKPKLEPRGYVKRRRVDPKKGATIPGVSLGASGNFKICRKAAEFCLGVSSRRVQRVVQGLPDGRTKGNRLPNDHPSLSTGPMSTCLRFLWRKYQFDAEGLPDRFKFEHLGGGHTLTIGANEHHNVLERCTDEIKEDEERAIAACALQMVSAHEPCNAVVVGPNTSWGPTRYLGVMKPIHLFLELDAWCKFQEVTTPSFHTLLRALDRCKCIRFRKVVGQHPNCDICVRHKNSLREAKDPRQRAAAMDDYCSHLLKQWMDRGVDGNCTELSRQCRRMLSMGHYLNTLAQQFSYWYIRIDGVDQAKFRVPRVRTKTHAFDKLLRPALHVQGAWCEGFAFHFAVADADMKKDSNNNIDVLARLIDQLYKQWHALPRTLSLIMDNTSRECKNQKIVKFATRLVAQGLIETVILNYPQKGHTHGPLDATFGQACVKLSLDEFDDDMDVVRILDGFLKESGLDVDSRLVSKAYKMDESPNWVGRRSLIGSI